MTRLHRHARHLIKFSAAILLFARTGVAYAQSTALQNPVTFGSIPDFIAGALKVLVIVALPIITLFFVVAGFQFIAAQGNESKLNEAKKNFVYVVIGALLILGAWVIATLIGGTVSQLTTGT